MTFRDDGRAQAIQIGAVLLFAILVTAYASYQALVVPDQNREVEFKHSQEVRGDLHDLRNTVVTGSGSVSVRLGTEYPSRALFLNPAPPSGSIRTVGTRNASLNLTVRNATATGEVGDFWDGSALRYPTGGLVHTPAYNELEGHSTYYEETVLYASGPERDAVLTGQRVVDGDRLTLVTLNGTLSRSRVGAVSLDARPVSVSTRTVAVRNDTENVTVSFPTRLSAEQWRGLLLEDGEFTNQSGHVEGVRAERLGPETRRLFIDLENGTTYDLRMKKVGLGTGVRPTESSYVVPVGSDTSTVTEGQTQRLVAEVRDRYNNPVSGQEVNATIVSGGGSLTSGEDTTDANGRATFEYQAPSTATTAEINVSFGDAPGPAENATFTVTVRDTNGGSGAYAVNWLDPNTTGDNPNAALSDCDSESCVWDVGNSADDTLTLRSDTTPDIEGITHDYGVNNSTVGTINPSEAITGPSGEATTELTAQDQGTIGVFVGSGGSSEDIDITVLNVGGGPPGFSSLSVSNLPPNSNGETQTLSFTPNQTIPDGETVSIDLDDAQGMTTGSDSSPNPVDYRNASVDGGSSSLDGGSATLSAYRNTASVTYTANGDVSAGTTIDIVITGIDTGDQETDINVIFDRNDGTSETTTFAVTN